MQAALKADFLTVEDYLAGEEASPLKHEYINGAVYAMAGTSREHHDIAQNLYRAFHARLRGGPCRAHVAEVKLRLNIQQQDIVYYPDVMVGCDARDTERLYLRFPKLLVEVTSESTERVDRHEKRLAYQTVETLEEYVLVAQDRPEVTVFRRANNWRAEVFSRADEGVALRSIDLELPLSMIYEDVLPEISRSE